MQLRGGGLLGPVHGCDRPPSPRLLDSSFRVADLQAHKKRAPGHLGGTIWCEGNGYKTVQYDAVIICSHIRCDAHPLPARVAIPSSPPFRTRVGGWVAAEPVRPAPPPVVWL